MTLAAHAGGHLRTTRAELVAILEAGGLTVQDAVDGRVATPTVLLDPGTPWSTRAAISRGAREVRWRITILAARIDNTGSLDLLSDTADTVAALLDAAPDWGSEDVTNVRALTFAGATYLAADVEAITTYVPRRT
jgi:hypothetical protein